MEAVFTTKNIGTHLPNWYQNTQRHISEQHYLTAHWNLEPQTSYRLDIYWMIDRVKALFQHLSGEPTEKTRCLWEDTSFLTASLITHLLNVSRRHYRPPNQRISSQKTHKPYLEGFWWFLTPEKMHIFMTQMGSETTTLCTETRIILLTPLYPTS